jgi:hypothetical protein
MLTPTGLAVGLEPPSVPDAAGTVSPNPLPEIWVPRWPVRRAIKQTKNFKSVDFRLTQVKQLPGNNFVAYKKIINNHSRSRRASPRPPLGFWIPRILTHEKNPGRVYTNAFLPEAQVQNMGNT